MSAPLCNVQLAVAVKLLDEHKASPLKLEITTTGLVPPIGR